MIESELTREQYDRLYAGDSYYWTVAPSPTCLDVLKCMPPVRPLRLLDIGCGEGRNAVFFARNGYHVHALDISERGLEKTAALAARAGVSVKTIHADLNTHRLADSYDVLFSVGVLHALQPALRAEIIAHFKDRTADGGINAFSVFVRKPFIAPAPDAEPNMHEWTSGEIMTLYHDWRFELCTEKIFDCNSSGIPHQHAVNDIIARKPV
jgi:tellurite methyltransferase